MCIYCNICCVLLCLFLSSCPISNFFSVSEWKIYVRKSANYKKSWERKYCQFFSMMKGIELQRGFPWPPHKNQNRIFLNLIRRNNSSWNCPKSHVSGRIFYDLSSSSFELLKVPWFIEWIWPILKMSIAFEAIWICTKVDQGFCLPGFSQNMYVYPNQ